MIINLFMERTLRRYIMDIWGKNSLPLSFVTIHRRGFSTALEFSEQGAGIKSQIDRKQQTFDFLVENKWLDFLFISKPVGSIQQWNKKNVLFWKLPSIMNNRNYLPFYLKLNTTIYQAQPEMYLYINLTTRYIRIY